MRDNNKILNFVFDLNSKNNYTEVNGLHLDMRPGIGSMDVKTILIDKNDNAEGTIMFDVLGNNFRGKTKSFTADELLPL